MQRKRQRYKTNPWRVLAPFIAAASVFLIFAVLVILTWPNQPDGRRLDVELITETDAVELIEIPDDPQNDGDPADILQKEPATDDIMQNNENLTEFSEIIGQVQPVISPVFTPLPKATAVTMIRTPVQLKSLAGGSRGLAGRTQALKRFGGDERIETAVMRGLRWIKQQQLPDGSWKAKGEGDATAFALLAFLSHGESFTSEEFGATVKAAVNYLIEHHGNNMAVYALTEAAAVIRTPVLCEAAANAVREFCLRQKPNLKANTGGIIQKYAAVMIPVSARLARLEIAELEAVRETYARAFLEMRASRGPDFRRIRGSGTWHFMVAGVCLQYLGHGEDGETRRMLSRLDELWVPATLGETEIACCPVRSNYFSTMIFFNAGGEPWERWNRGMLDAYLETQEREGELGYWHCRDQHIGDQPFWTTCYIVHQLMVYYRYLPTYSKEAWSPAERTGDRDWRDPNEVTVEVDI